MRHILKKKMWSQDDNLRKPIGFCRIMSNFIFVDMLKDVHKYERSVNSKAPAVYHCSAGVGLLH